jgi:hypothetical protein
MNCTHRRLFATHYVAIRHSHSHRGVSESMSGSARRTGANATGMIFGAAALMLLASPSHAQSGPFAGLAGSWSGSGTIGMSSGERERIRCRATYAVGGGGNTLRQSLRCASDSYRFDLGSDVRSAGGAIYGSWSEATRGVGGELSGTARGLHHAQPAVSRVGWPSRLKSLRRRLPLRSCSPSHERGYTHMALDFVLFLF